MDSNTPVLSVEETQHRKDASASMILGIIGDAFAFIPFLGIGGIILSVLALLKSNRNRIYAEEHFLQESKLNIAGKWCGIGGIIVGGVFLLIWLVVFIILILIMIGVFERIS